MQSVKLPQKSIWGGVMKFTPDNYEYWEVEPARLYPKKKNELPLLNWGLIITLILLMLFIGLITKCQLGGM